MSINHTYYEKEMRNHILIPERSAMPIKQKMNILSNEIIRRLSNIKVECAEEKEVVKVMDQFTVQMKGSGYDRKKTKEVVEAGALGWMRKRKRREEERTKFYRSASSTLRTRIRKKLIDKTNWYKDSK